MIAIDERTIAAPADVCFDVAADVERWPHILPHYRWVRFQRRDAFGTGRVEMAAWRRFPIGSYPTWWVSEMHVERDVPVVRYTHVDGVTRGMDVRWEFHPAAAGTHVRIVHEWSGPRWPFGRWIARGIIGPHFVSAIAQRTLEGVAAECERRTARPRETRNTTPEPDRIA